MDNAVANYFNVSVGKSSPVIIPGFGRKHLAKMFSDFGYKTGAEIGVERGLYSKVICDSNPDCHLYCIDAWINYEQYHDYLNYSDISSLYRDAVQRLLGYNATFIRSFSFDAVKLFEDESLDFVYIDANHSFDFVVRDICEWAKKVKPGGIVSGHDYRKSTHKETSIHVIQAVNAYTSAYNIHPWFVLGSDKRTRGEFRDSSRTWFWQKQ